MGSHEDGGTLTVSVMEDLDDLLSIAQVEVPGRLVREDDVRFCDERASEGNTLLLSPRQRTAPTMLVSREADLVQVLVHFLADDPFAHASDSQRQLHVFIHGAVEEQHVVLEHHAHSPSQRRERAAMSRRRIRSIYQDGAIRRPFSTIDKSQNGAFSCARFTCQKDELARAYLESDIPETIVSIVISL